jgi:hypothetical protein
MPPPVAWMQKVMISEMTKVHETLSGLRKR